MSQNMYGKEKTCESRFHWNLKLFTKVFTVGQMLSHAGWSKFLCYFTENECSVTENFRKF